jgi:hypothetical protein
MRTNHQNDVHTPHSFEWCRWAKVISLLALIFVIVPAVSFANTITWDGNSQHCGDQCCHDFTVTITQPTDQINIDLWDWGGGPDCFDHLCWSNQSTGSRHFVQGADGPWSFEIDIDHTDPAWTGTFPLTIHVWICGTYDCMKDYDQWWWATRPTYESGNPSPISSGDCRSIEPCGSGCSFISASPSGTGFGNACGTEICFHNQSGGLVTSFTLNFQPRIDLNNPCPSGPTGGPRCNFAPYNSTHVVFSNCAWTIDPPDPFGNVTIHTPPGSKCGVSNCNELCIFVPACVTGFNDEIISLQTPINPSNCNADDIVVKAAMKKSDQPSLKSQDESSGNQNYPNPIDANGGFKTIIPFATSASGTASIRIVDATGKEVLSDNEDVTYSGKHFFYVTADKLPTGTYYYTIEFPKGVVIASKTMLVVK